MNKVLQVFHKINDGLTRIETAPRGEAARIAEALKLINEELCDKFIEILNEKNERGTTETSSNS
jgi:hypothetical protein